MRPKVVIFILVVGFGLLGMIAVLKGLGGKHAGDSDQSASNSAGKTGASTGTNAATAQVGTAGSPQVSEEMRAALVSHEIDQIQQLQGEVDGSNNPVIIQALLEKVVHPEAEVRKAAVQALREMNDTNAIPGLQKVADATQDAREKVALLDAIDYLNLPDIMPAVPPADLDTNVLSPQKVPASQMNEHFMRETKKKQKNRVQAASQDNQVAQPQ